MAGLAAAAARSRCLLVLDNVETLFEPLQQEGRYRAELAGYGRLLQDPGRSQPPELSAADQPRGAAGVGVLGGFSPQLATGRSGVDEAQALLASKQLVGTSAHGRSCA